MNISAAIACLKRPFLGTIWMWLIGSFLSQIVIFIIAPKTYYEGGPFYLLMTLAYSAAGVFTFGFTTLFIFHHFPRIFAPVATWQYGIPAGIIGGWMATVLLIVITLIITGDTNELAQPLRWLFAALFGSFYGLVGAIYMLLTNNESNHALRLSPHPGRGD